MDMPRFGSKPLRWSLAAALAGAASAASAQTGYVDVTYSGSITEVAADAPNSLAVGTPITFDVVFDQAKLTDYTSLFTNNFGPFDPGVVTSVETASLSDDPSASLTIRAGDISFTKFDGIRYGTPCGEIPVAYCGADPTHLQPTDGLGVGDLPSATYLNGKFAGVGNIFINAAGYSLDADPLADLLQATDPGNDGSTFGLQGPETGNGDFYLGLGDLNNPFTHGLAIGKIDSTSVRITALPEVGTWATLLLGFGVVGFNMRRRRWPAGASRVMG